MTVAAPRQVALDGTVSRPRFHYLECPKCQQKHYVCTCAQVLGRK